MTTVEIIVHPKKEVLDPEARAIKDVLVRRASDAVLDLHIAKRFLITINAAESEALELARKIASEYLSNPVAQSFEIRKV